MMMDNPAHHLPQVVQLNNANPQPIMMKTPAEMENFLTIRLLMQGKVIIAPWRDFSFVHHSNVFRKLAVLLENEVITSKPFEKKYVSHRRREKTLVRTSFFFLEWCSY